MTLVGNTLLGSTSRSTFNQSDNSGVIFSFQDAVNYTEGGPAAAPLGNVTVTIASNDTDLTGAAVAISPTSFQSGDTLTFVNQNGITGSYNSGTGTLTLTGSATAAQYQAAMRSITFLSTSSSLTNRQISVVTVDDGNTQASNTLWESVDVSPPVTLTAAYGPAWLRGQASIPT